MTECVSTKCCALCRRELPLASFGKNAAMPDGYRYECKECRNEASRARPTDSPSRVREREARKSWGADHPNRVRERSRGKKNYRANPVLYQQRHRQEKLKRVYGITVERFDMMFVAQSGRCAICSTSDFQGKRPHVDHDHRTGAVRGLLCVRCNQGLGNFLDTPELLRAAALYLEKQQLLELTEG